MNPAPFDDEGEISKAPLTDASLTGSDVETWIYKHGEGKFICFRNRRGELFHFKANKLLRGKPCAPYNTIEEFTRPANILTLENASHVAGISSAALKYHIAQGNLKAIKKKWRYGANVRRGLLVRIDDLQDFIAKRAIEKHKGKLIEWDVSPRDLLK